MSQYESLRLLTDDLAGTFTAMGHPVVVVDLLDPGWPDRLRAFLDRQTLLCVFGLQSWGAGLTFRQDDGKDHELLDILGCPLAAVFCDQPFHHAQHALKQHPQRLCIWETPNYVDLLRRGGVDVTEHHAVSGMAPQRRRDPPPIATRPHPVAFIGGYQDPDEIAKDPCFHHGLTSDLMQRARERIHDDPACDSWDVLFEEIQRIGMDPAKSDPIRLMYLCDRLNAYERYLWRDRTLRSIGSFPVAVMGTDWHQMRNPPPGLRILPEPYPTGAEAWCSTALSLNVLPGNRQGCHDRLLGALAHGTAVITDRNQWTDRYITDGVDGWTFDRRDPQLASRLAEITADRDRLAAVAAAGQSGIGRHSDNRRFLGQVLDLVRSWRTRMWLRGR